ncbi:acetyl-CoA carboxylase biotin carboxylase subunit [Paractinoplanes toevensis]|uniref:Biotin carboxylase n=1 Tax=Paractinoplanes toevensis TaxID=571911 RepID=A0A919TBY2_9ACTN|nr:acetyl-CoA carboxylase biotin carboxylase subunit [Actinoplanes toevensis]GIM92608.1 acetyl-CoA carboxylase biotin carboxylase subunit [Actinoplanes toevensis]
MFERLLIANRGEIAVRVIRACRELGISPIAVYSAADADSLHVELADDAVCIGPAAAKASYLHIPNVIGAAVKSGAQAIHPGYGFLSEDPYFAEICAENGIVFIGPPPDVMESAGDKAITRRVMIEAGLPVLPGTSEAVASLDEALTIGGRIGYPVVVKAAAGGGGRGIAVARDPHQLRTAYLETRRNAQAIFGDGRVYLERFLDGPRHIEVQILADDYGNVIHLGERDCSVQRRHQKLIEEGPSPALTADRRAEIGTAAVRAAEAIGYRGAGTVEFLLEDDGQFWFMEMNGRIQVEHPVTEAISGVDLVAAQIRIAVGEPLALTQEMVSLTGHAIECRINAEDPGRDFAPTPGVLTAYRPPDGPGIRVDSHCRPDARISPHYDSMIAKLIAWGPDRDTALRRMRRALDEMRLDGPGLRTTIDFHRGVLDDPVFCRGEAHTDFLTRRRPA